jgi:excinuclease UvrABC nuclease subunit
MEKPSASVQHFPATSGVYLMRSRDDTVLYVGKAKSLRNRVRSYFSRDRDPKTTVLMKKVDRIEYVVCRNEYEALLLENNLIKEYRPRNTISTSRTARPTRSSGSRTRSTRASSARVTLSTTEASTSVRSRTCTASTSTSS